MTAHHAMQLTQTYPTGAEEWKCTICGYKIVMIWPPDYKKIPLVEGDQSAAHSCTKNGLAATDDTRLEPFEDWLRKHGG